MTSSNTSKSFASVTANTKGSEQNGEAGFKTRQRPDAIRNSNIVAAKGNKVIDFERKIIG
jgi:T-complex protein 1 subunit delta